MNKLNPIEDNIIEKDQSKQTPAKLELNNHQINLSLIHISEPTRPY